MLKSQPLIFFNTWLEKILFLCFDALLILTPFVFTWVNEELFEFNKMLFVYIITSLLACSWLGLSIIRKKALIKKTPLDWPILALLIAFAISTITSIHPPTSIIGYYTRFNGGLLSFSAYVVIFYALISFVKQKRVPALVISLIVGASLACLYAIPEHFGHSFSCLIIGGKFNVACWVQQVQVRIFGTFGQPNWLAAYIITILPVSVSIYLSTLFSTKNGQHASVFAKLRQPIFISIGLMFLTLLYTRSRSGFLGLAIGLFCLLIGIIFIAKRKNINLKKLQLSKWLVILFVGLSISSGTPFTPSIKDVLFSNNQLPVATETDPPAVIDGGGTESGEIRKIVWKGALAVWKRYPWFGSGLETFAYSYYQDRPIEHNMVSEWDFLYNKAHNEFVNFLATTGAVGLGAYLVFLGSIVLLGVKIIRTSTTHNSLLATGLVAGIVGQAASNFFGFSTVISNLLLFVFAAILVILAQQEFSKVANEPQIQIKPGFQFTQLILLSLCLILFKSLVDRVGRTWQADRDYASAKAFSQAGETLQSAQAVQKAILLSPNEALFYDLLGESYAKLAVNYYAAGEASTSAELENAAILSSQHALELNPRHLNFYKTAARIYITLAQINPSYLENAEQTLQKAIEKSPTDAKLKYNLGLVKIGRDRVDEGMIDIETAILMKPNYTTARFEYAKRLESQNKLYEAKDQYQYILDNIVPDHPQVIEQLDRLEASISAQQQK